MGSLVSIASNFSKLKTNVFFAGLNSFTIFNFSNLFAWLLGNEICPLKKLKIFWISRGRVGGGAPKKIKIPVFPLQFFKPFCLAAWEMKFIQKKLKVFWISRGVTLKI